MQEYETIYVLQPDLPNARQSKVLEKVSKILKDNKAKVLEQKDWGKRKLAYPIRKFEHGQYIYFNYSGEGTFIPDLERTLKLEESVLRFLTVKNRPLTATGKSKKPQKVTHPDDDVKLEQRASTDDRRYR